MIPRRLRPAALALALLGYLTPILWLCLAGFKHRVDAVAIPPKLLFAPTMGNVPRALFAEGFAEALGNSLRVASMTTILSLLLGAPAAYAASRMAPTPRRRVLFSLLSTRIVPAMVLVIPVYSILADLRLLDHIGSVVLMHVSAGVGITAFLLEGFFRSIPRRIEEIAVLDGRGPVGTFVHLVLPATTPGLLIVGLIAFVMSWGEFAFASTIGSFAARTLPVGIPALVSIVGTKWGEAGVVSLLAISPALLLAILGRPLVARVAMVTVARTAWART